MSQRKILVALSTFGEYGEKPIRLLEESGFFYLINPLKKRLVKEEIIAMGKDCEGIIAGVEPYDEDALNHLSKLRCISRCGVGIENIALQKAREMGITVLNTPDVVVQPVVELTIAMIFDLLRKISYHTALMKVRRWEKKAGHLLMGRKIGIIGLGRIGKRVAEVLKIFGAHVSGYDPFPDKQWANTNGIEIFSCEQIIRESDILSLHLSVIPGSPFRLGEQEIQSMKKGAMIVNVARGEFIDEDALYTALRDGHLAGAALDVFPEEPYRGKLCELDNVVLTPHCATLTEESRLQMEVESTANLIEFLKKL
ncbi:MAG: NAD(P)-dependent oxidoreductase [bacterium]|nr:NAD(P)-dependent oxidoreductase [bacterium]